MSSILPSGESVSVTPSEIKRYLNENGLRQMLHQERLHWKLKTATDVDYYDNVRLWKYSGELHNAPLYMRMELRTFSDNGAHGGYAGLNIDSGQFGYIHNVESWDHALSSTAPSILANRLQIGALAAIPGKSGYGIDDDGYISTVTSNRMAMMVFDPYDGRIYALTNDDPAYVNNSLRSSETKLPLRTVARIGDIPTNITDLNNDLDFVADPDYHHTDNNFNNSHRYLVDNLDDRTFVYPEIAKDTSGNYIANNRVGLLGECSYGDNDGTIGISQPDLGENPDLGDHGDRYGENISSYGHNVTFSGVYHESGYFPGIFRSIEELERVDLIDQLKTPLTHVATPGAKRQQNYYSFDGVWGSNWFDREMYKDSYLGHPLIPTNMEVITDDGQEPTPYSQVSSSNQETWNRATLYQWRYNRISLQYHSSDITIAIIASGQSYEVGDILRYTFADDVFQYEVTTVGPNGQIQAGKYIESVGRIYEQDPSTHGVGIYFTNSSSVGNGALLSISCKATIENHSTQLKNNLYAYVDVVPCVRSDNTTEWSDISEPNDDGGTINIRSTAGGPGYTGINTGRGGPEPTSNLSTYKYHEHGGNATAGVQLHLFRYVINTQSPTWVIRNGIQIFTGEWVDQGPMGVERPCDIKALFLSNSDTNNFNNYYKFMLDGIFNTTVGNPDGVITGDDNALAAVYRHVADRDPEPEQKFYIDGVSSSGGYERTDVTPQVEYINAATGVKFYYNAGYKNDPNYGYGASGIGWHAIAGVTAK